MIDAEKHLMPETNSITWNQCSKIRWSGKNRRSLNLIFALIFWWTVPIFSEQWWFFGEQCQFFQKSDPADPIKFRRFLEKLAAFLNSTCNCTREWRLGAAPGGWKQGPNGRMRSTGSQWKILKQLSVGLKNENLAQMKMRRATDLGA
jgi:hypothetical protein